MKKIIGTLFLLIIIVVLFAFIKKKERCKETIVRNYGNEKLVAKIADVQKLIKTTKKYNSEIGFFIDMEINSGKNRFFVYNFTTKKISDQGLVANGSGSETGIAGKLKFSNENNSYATSLGKYSVGGSYNGKFGKTYKLYGLDKTNSNAFNRNIVLHKYFDVPYEEQDNYICNSLGCPMVNEKFYGRLEKLIDNSKNSIIMNIYY